MAFFNDAKILIFLIASLFFSFSHASRVFIFDYDSTIVEDRSDLGGVHITPYTLFRVHFNTVSIQPEIDGPETIEISHLDYERLTRPIRYDQLTKAPQEPVLLAPQDGRVGSLKPFQLTDGRVIVPGHYRIDPHLTFSRFNEAPHGQNHLEKHFAEGFARAQRGEGRLAADFFGLLYHLINNPETRKDVYVVSSRGHSTAEISEKLKRDRDQRRLIAADVTDEELLGLANRSLMLMRPEHQSKLQYLGPSQMGALKAATVKDIALALVRANPNSYVEHLSPSGQDTERGTELYFFEDRYDYLEAVRKELQDLVNRRIGGLKVFMFNSGRDEDVFVSEKPRAYILTPYGLEREIHRKEWRDSHNPVLQYLASKTLREKNPIVVCREILSNLRKGGEK